MRKASRPSSASVSTRSRKAMSSSMLIRSGARPLARGQRRRSVFASERARNSILVALARGASLLAENARRPELDQNPSRHQLVAPGLGDQNGRIGGIALDLLAQSVDVGFERVRRHPGIVAPHFLQQDLARDRALPGAIEIAQDRGFLFGQANLVAFG